MWFREEMQAYESNAVPDIDGACNEEVGEAHEEGEYARGRREIGGFTDGGQEKPLT